MVGQNLLEPARGLQAALKGAQATTGIAFAAASTTIILAAIIVQTRYLASKLDKIQVTIDLISQDIHSQNILFYMDKISDYFGAVEAARSWLFDRDLADEIRDVAIPLLAELVSKRNQLLSFIDNILDLAKTPALSARHFDLIVNFVRMMLDLIPKGIHVEYLLSARIGKIGLAEQILWDGGERHKTALDVYRDFLNNLHRDFVMGVIGDRVETYQVIEHQAEALFASEENQLLLSIPWPRVALGRPSALSHDR